MMNNFSLLIIMLLCLISPTEILAQDNSTKKDSVAVWVLTKDGNEYRGYLEVQNSSELTLRTPSLGRITIPMLQIRKFREIRPSEIDKPYSSMSSAYFSRYYLSSSALTLRKNEGYYHNSLFVFNRLEYGINDWWSIGGETGIIRPDGEFMGGITTRFQVPVGSDNFHLGVKGLFGASFDGGLTLGQALGILTFGPADRNVSVGIGYTFYEGESTQGPTYQIAGNYRVGRKGAIIIDIHHIDTGGNILNFYMFGGRHRFRRVGLDYAIAVIQDPNSGFPVPIPWLGLTIPF